MSILNKLMDTMRLTENDDDYFDEEDYEEEKPVIKKRSFGKRDEEMDDYRHEEESKPRFLPRSSNNKVVQMRRSMEVSLIKPTSMEDTREICDYLLAGKAVVLNMEGIHMEVAQRIIDFTCGATLDLDRYMIQFESERFMTFEISSEETQGLKIPVSSVMEKEFYTIPVDYMTTGGNATEDEAGFNKEVYGEGGKASIEFVTPEIYSSTDEYYYVEKSDDGLLKSGDYLVKPDSNERFQVGPTAKLTGAYNINKGYAVFKQVKELANSGEYYIVEKGTKYGLSVYDHIVLDASTVSDGQIVYQ